MEQDSGFIVSPELDGQVAAPQLLHRSETGFSEVWRVMKFSQFVVLKALKSEYRGDPVYEALLRKEFELGYSLNHPSVCRTWHFRHDGRLGNCIEMEWVDGVTLEERFRDARPDEALFRKIAGELCDAVAYLHSRQILHRDLKPSNILITHNGDNIKLIDFGLADSDDSAVLKMAAGTKRYVAPEILAGESADVRTDIWGAGQVLASLTDGHGAALRKATALRREDRYPRISDFKDALLHRSARLWPWLLAVLAAILLAGGILLRDKPGQITEPAEAPTKPLPDPVQTEEPAPAELRRQRPAEPKPPVSAPDRADASGEEIENLFREATDLFD